MSRTAVILAAVVLLLASCAAAQFTIAPIDVPSVVYHGTTVSITFTIDTAGWSSNTQPATNAPEATYTIDATASASTVSVVGTGQFTISRSQPQGTITLTVAANTDDYSAYSFYMKSSNTANGADSAQVTIPVGARSIAISTDVYPDCADSSLCSNANELFYTIPSKPIWVSTDVQLTGTQSVTLQPFVRDPSSTFDATCSFSPATITLSAGVQAAWFTLACVYSNGLNSTTSTALRFTVTEPGSQNLFNLDFANTYLAGPALAFAPQPLAVYSTSLTGLVGYSMSFAVYSPTGPVGSPVTLTYFGWGLGISSPFPTVAFATGDEFKTVSVTLQGVDSTAPTTRSITWFTSDDLRFVQPAPVSFTVEKLPTPVVSVDGGQVNIHPGNPVQVSVHTLVPTPTGLGYALTSDGGLRFSADGATAWSSTFQLSFSPTVSSASFWVDVDPASWIPQSTGDTIYFAINGNDVALYDLGSSGGAFSVPVTTTQVKFHVTPQFASATFLPGAVASATIVLDGPVPYGGSITLTSTQPFGSHLSVSPSTLVFTGASLAQTVTVTTDLDLSGASGAIGAINFGASASDNSLKFLNGFTVSLPLNALARSLATYAVTSPSSFSPAGTVGVGYDATTITLNSAPPTSVTFTAWAPYMTATPASVTFTPGALTQSFAFSTNVQAVDDNTAVPNSNVFYLAVSGPDAYLYASLAGQYTAGSGSQQQKPRTISIALSSVSGDNYVGEQQTLTFSLNAPVTSSLVITASSFNLASYFAFSPAGPWTIPAGASGLTVTLTPLVVLVDSVPVTFRLSGPDAQLYSWPSSDPHEASNTVSVSSEYIGVSLSAVSNSFSVDAVNAFSLTLDAPPPTDVTFTLGGWGIVWDTPTVTFTAGQTRKWLQASVDPSIFTPFGSGLALARAASQFTVQPLITGISGTDAGLFQGAFDWHTQSVVLSTVRVALTGAGLASGTANNLAGVINAGGSGNQGVVTLSRATTNGLTVNVNSACFASPIAVVVAPGTASQAFTYDVSAYGNVGSPACNLYYTVTGPDAAWYSAPTSAVPATIASYNIFIGSTNINAFNFGAGYGYNGDLFFTVGVTSTPFHVALSGPPAEGVTLTFHSEYATFSPASLSFTSNKWTADFTVTPTQATPDVGYVTYSVSGPDAASFFGSVSAVKSTIRVRPDMAFGPLQSVPFGSRSNSWAAVTSPATTWVPFNLILTCGGFAGLQQPAASAAYTFSPVSLSYDPAQGSTFNQTFNYGPSARRLTASSGATIQACAVQFLYVPRSYVGGLAVASALPYYAPASNYQLNWLTLGSVLLDLPANFRSNDWRSFRVYLSPAPAGEVRITPRAANLVFNPPVLVFAPGQSMVEASAMGVALTYNQYSYNVPAQISWTLDSNSQTLYASPPSTYARINGAGSLAVSAVVLLTALVAALL